jgi:hypothetical protein
MPRRLLCLLGITLLLCGCASFASQRKDNARRLDQIFSECRTKFRESAGYAAEALCAHQPIRRLYAEREYPYMDLVDLYLAHWLTIARQVDQGRLRADEAQMQLTEQLFRVTKEADQRDGRYTSFHLMLVDLRPSLLD